ncbi:hypothetical protein [Pseudomonas sp. BP8]|uniref:hypothetical protein n=1 Tax=Pseudomonas sp. BP8 TaxID=2817864 RepID=UPI001AE149D9|nr:hypothetical protein [Pseudomonas sp. BP8]MBP2262196.1 hypothetical protein [Pseudomonas sp. BP8]HDS1733123.1 hypothetical protein [Pseudomonas putida]
MREITLEEAASVNGAQGIPGAVAGAISGGAGYVGGLTGNGQFNTTDFAASVGAGALLGAVTGANGVSKAATLGGAVAGFGAGVIVGNASRLESGGA